LNNGIIYVEIIIQNCIDNVF